MPLSKEHKARTRERIVGAAGAVFRRQGYAAAKIDEVMAEAGLTRGGFYAHFADKAALFAEVLATDHGLLRQLARRDGADAVAWRRQTGQIFADYLAPAHLGVVAAGCSFAALTGEVKRSGDAAHDGYRAAWRRAVGELLRSHQPGDDWRHALHEATFAERQRAALVLGLAIGTVQIAVALSDETMAPALLGAAAAEVERWLGG
jgi:TetR/AcrR family transcriptional regulator, transcriptional repressor for nem operon